MVASMALWILWFFAEDKPLAQSLIDFKKIILFISSLHIFHLALISNKRSDCVLYTYRHHYSIWKIEGFIYTLLHL